MNKFIMILKAVLSRIDIPQKDHNGDYAARKDGFVWLMEDPVFMKAAFLAWRFTAEDEEAFCIALNRILHGLFHTNERAQHEFRASVARVNCIRARRALLVRLLYSVKCLHERRRK